MARPSPEAIEWALGQIIGAHGPDGPATEEDDAAIDIIRAAVKLPPLVGNRAAAEILGVESGNLGKQRDLPAPLYDLPAGKFYDEDEIREVAARRAANDDTTETVPNG